MNCKECKWWKENIFIGREGHQEGIAYKTGVGTCHFEPPKIDGWPETKIKDFCSEFTKKE